MSFSIMRCKPRTWPSIRRDRRGRRRPAAGCPPDQPLITDPSPKPTAMHVVLDHALQAADLAFDTPEAVEVVGTVHRVAPHGRSSVQAGSTTTVAVMPAWRCPATEQ